ncbi:protein of unknown function [Geodermatophilus telluris]|uniref:DUF4333 domain-containing protein n=1 Tax=Geodermatophilus telluris TaxID=1190417 RepID=A0A1G6R0D0_9ACTN|nr:DUF4333 domain-containing protein [Geodermatophilus telluris]SDC98089.1 protein of unknown function [Geodermatophilus telluris]
MTQIHDPRYGAPNPQGPGPYGPPPFPAPGYGAPGGFGGPQHRKKSHTGAIVGSIVAVLVVAGLGIGAFFLFSTSYLDTAEAERQIAALTEEQAGVTVTDVSCPEDVELAAGTVTECTAMVEGQEVGYTVEQTDDEGNVRIDSTGVFVQVADVEALLTEQFASEAGLEVTSTCDAGDRSVLVAADGLELTCEAALVDDPTDTGTVTALVDAEGNVTFDAS